MSDDRMARILARKRERERQMREKEENAREARLATAKKEAAEKERKLAVLRPPRHEAAETKADKEVASSDEPRSKANRDVAEGVAKMRWKRVDGTWAMVKEEVHARDDMRTQREAIKWAGSQTVLENAASSRWRKHGGSWSGQAKPSRTKRSDDATFYQSKVTILNLPKEAYDQFDIADALYRPDDYQTACSLLRALIGQFYPTSSLSTQKAMFADVDRALKQLGTPEVCLESHYSAVLGALLVFIGSIDLQLMQHGVAAAGFTKETDKATEGEAVHTTEEEGAPDVRQSTLLDDPYVKVLLERRTKLLEWHDSQAAVLRKMQVKNALGTLEGGMGGLTYFPPEMLMRIFLWLPVQELGSICRVCQMWNVVASDDFIFHQLLVRDYPKKLADAEKEKAMSSTSWKGLYRNYSLRQDTALRGICQCGRCTSFYWRVWRTCRECGASALHQSRKLDVGEVVELLTKA